MNTGFRTTVLLSAALALTSLARGQAVPTATQPIQIYGFGAATGTWTGLNGGRNLGLTAGIDFGWRPYRGYYPSLELRGTYPVDGGQIAAERNVLYGLKVSRFYGPVHPYANFLLGRDKIDYQNGGYANASNTLLYIDSVSNIFSYGGGADIDVTDHFGLKLDGQYQQIGVPVTPSGHIFSTALSVGVVYHLDFNHHIRYDDEGQVKGYRPPPPPRRQPLPPPAPAPDSGTSNPPPPSPDGAQPQ